MARLKLPLVVAAVLLVGAAAGWTGDMALARSGDLYRAAQTENGIIVTVTSGDGSARELAVPQTAGSDVRAIEVAVDERTGSLFLLWQESDGQQATVLLAHYTQDAWFGPLVLAGGTGAAAMNPELLLFRHSATLENETDEIDQGEEGDAGQQSESRQSATVEDTFLHVAWWGYFETVDDGSAFYAAIPLENDGMPVLDEAIPRPVSDLLPFGIGCSGISDAPALAHPRLFVDPETGLPHLFATDFGQCLFQIIPLEYRPIDDSMAKRRRRVVEFGRSQVLAVRGDVPLAIAKVEVGHGLTVVLHWDADASVEYVRFDDHGLPVRQSLKLGEHLGRERAVELIRTLSH